MRHRKHDAFDIIVAGAGPAGVCAALAAARRGARVLLLEKSPCAGGAWTTGCMNLVFDFTGKPGLLLEIREALTAEGAWEPWAEWRGASETAPAVFAVEAMKRLLDDMLASAGVTTRYLTLVIGATVEERRIVSVTTASKSGLETWRAKVLIDATGDGDLAARAGCAFEQGRESDGRMQPGTMFALVGGWPEPLPVSARVRAALEETGYQPSYEHVTIFPVPGSSRVAYLMANHLYGLDASDAGSMTAALVQGRRELHQAVNSLRKAHADFRNLAVLQTGPEVAIREGRRIAGLYRLRVQDLRAGRSFEDGVCTVRFNVDVHSVDPAEGTGLTLEPVAPYRIPYRSLVARDVDNLLLAGRLISGDFLSHASYRVTGDCAAMGEVAGRAGAFCVKEDLSPAQVPAAAVAL